MSMNPGASRDGSVDEDGVVDAAVEPPFFRSDETCATTSIVPPGYPSHCRQTRSCRSCLQKAGCMIDQYGACVNQFVGRFSAWTNYSMAYALDLVLPNATTTNPQSTYASQSWHFRAFEATYCPESDPVCRECITRRFWSPSSRPDSRFCEGKNGCVCISDCEDRWYTPEFQCIESTPVPIASAVFEPVGKSFDAVVKIMLLGMGLILVLFAACLFRCIRKDYDNGRQRERRLRLAREARGAMREQQRQRRLSKLGVSALSLSGWQTFRQSLIEKEKQRLGSDTPSDTTATVDPMPSPSATPYVLSIDDDSRVNDRISISAAITNNVRPANLSPRSAQGAAMAEHATRTSVQ